MVEQLVAFEGLSYMGLGLMSVSNFISLLSFLCSGLSF
jgi:hypothetical protein